MEKKIETMTISKALRFAKSLKGQFAKLTNKAREVLNWEVGKEPKVLFKDVIAEKDRVTNLLTRVKTAITASNATSFITFEDVQLLVQDAIYIMDELKGEKSFFESLNPTWSETIDFPRTVVTEGEKKGELIYKEVKRVCNSALTMEARQEKVDAIQARIDALNDALEFHNHGTTITVEIS